MTDLTPAELMDDDRSLFGEDFREDDMTDLAKAIAELPDYDAGLLNDFGGGNIDWWQDYIRAEIGRANDQWRANISVLCGEPIPLADHKLAVAEAYRRVVEEVGRIDPNTLEGREDLMRRVISTILSLAPTDALAEVQALRQTIARLRRLDEGYGKVETAIIMADLDFDGDSNHSSPEDRLIASVERLKSRAEAAEAENPRLAAQVNMLRDALSIAGPIALEDFAGHPFCYNEEERRKIAVIRAALEGAKP